MVETTKVLVLVEDDQDLRALIRMQLSVDQRLELVGEAASAEEALELLGDIVPGLIILDHGLQGKLTGLESAPLMKAITPEAKILLFTAYDMRAEALAEPAIDEYLRKDHFELLLPTIERLLDLGPVAA